MWSLLGYPSTPPMPPGAMPVVSRLAVSRAEGLHAWEAVFRAGVDAGRMEVAALAVAVVLGVVVLAAVAGAAWRAAGALLRWVAS